MKLVKCIRRLIPTLRTRLCPDRSRPQNQAYNCRRPYTCISARRKPLEIIYRVYRESLRVTRPLARTQTERLRLMIDSRNRQEVAQPVSSRPPAEATTLQ